MPNCAAEYNVGMTKYKIVVYVPVSHANKVREAMGKAGAGRIGNYSLASFSTRGIGRFKPEAGARPAIGKVGKLEEVEEEKIEAVCDDTVLESVIAAVKAVHPYEEPAIEAWPLSYPS